MEEVQTKNVAPQSEETTNPLDKYTKIPLEGFTAECKKFIEETSAVLQVPRDMTTLFALTTIGANVGNKVCSNDDFGRINFPQLYTCVCANVGTGKSPVFRTILEPLKQLDKARYQDYRNLREEWEKSKPEDRGRRPISNAKIIEDITPEFLVERMNASDGNLYAVDELSGFFNNFNRYHIGNEEQRFLSIYNNEQLSVETKTNGSILIEKPVLSIIGGTQPKVLYNTFCKRDRMSNGFFHRFCFVYVPDVIIPSLDYSIKKETDCKFWNEYLTSVRNFYNIESELRFTDLAKEIIQSFVNGTKAQKIKEYLLNPDKANIWQKSEFFLHRISLILAIGKQKQCIDEEEVSSAVKIVKVLCRYSEQILDYFETAELQTIKPLSKPDVVRQFAEHFPTFRENVADVEKLLKVGKMDGSYFRNTLNRSRND